MTLRDDIRNDPNCASALAARDCVEMARIRSIGRTVRVSKTITERGIRSLVSISAGSQFIRLLKEASETVGVPPWLSSVLTAMSVPTEGHQDYADAVASAYGWLRQECGLDIAPAATRGLLDVIAASNPAKFGATVATIKALSDQPTSYSALDVSKALYNDTDGSDR